jgi:hypothetical protein
MRNVAVSETSLECPRIVATIGQRVATGVPEHVRVRLEGELGLPSRPLDHTSEPGSAKRLLLLRLNTNDDFDSCSR